MFNLLIQEMRNRRGGMIGWGLGMALMGIMMVALYPSFADSFAGIELPEFYEVFGDIDDMTSFEGFLDIEFFSWIPIMLGIYALVIGSGTLAGEEDSGTLEVLLSMPIPRWQLVLVKAVAIAIALMVILLAAGLGLVIGFLSIQGQIETEITSPDLVRVMIYTWPMLILWAMMSLFLGAVLPSRRLVNVFMTIVVIAAFFMDSLGELASQIEALQPYSPFYYFQPRDVLISGWHPEGMLLLSGMALLFLVLAIAGFQLRDVTVGAWPWHRFQIPEEYR